MCCFAPSSPPLVHLPCGARACGLLKKKIGGVCVSVHMCMCVCARVDVHSAAVSAGQSQVADGIEGGE